MQRRGMGPEVLRDLLNGRLGITTPRDPDDVLTELSGERLGHSDILSQPASRPVRSDVTPRTGASIPRFARRSRR